MADAADKEREREQDRERARKRRAAKGAKPRAQYLAEAAAKAEQWQAERRLAPAAGSPPRHKSVRLGRWHKSVRPPRSSR